MTPAERIAHVQEVCRCPVDAEFARWIGVKSSQVVGNWTKRRIPRDGALKISKASGASVEWLISDDGEGEPFPNGPTFYAPADPADQLEEFREREAQMATVIFQLLRAVVATTPSAGQRLEKALKGELGERPAGNALLLDEALQIVQQARKSASR
jgi:hypothetical protein